MSIPLLQKLHVGSYLVRQNLSGRKRYPLVLMLEPLFRCNLACAGCGKIDYPDEILQRERRWEPSAASQWSGIAGTAVGCEVMPDRAERPAP